MADEAQQDVGRGVIAFVMQVAHDPSLTDEQKVSRLINRYPWMSIEQARAMLEAVSAIEEVEDHARSVEATRIANPAIAPPAQPDPATVQATADEVIRRLNMAVRMGAR